MIIKLLILLIVVACLCATGCSSILEVECKSPKPINIKPILDYEFTPLFTIARK